MNADFWKAVGIRALRTWIEAFLAAIPATFATGIDWVLAVETACYAAAISALLAISTGLPETPATK
jgi:hypothetical protein